MVALIIILTGLLYLVKISETLTIPLFLTFLILKLTGVVAWSWFVICVPLIAVPMLFLMQVVIIALITVCAEEM